MLGRVVVRHASGKHNQKDHGKGSKSGKGGKGKKGKGKKGKVKLTEAEDLGRIFAGMSKKQWRKAAKKSAKREVKLLRDLRKKAKKTGIPQSDPRVRWFVFPDAANWIELLAEYSPPHEDRDRPGEALGRGDGRGHRRDRRGDARPDRTVHGVRGRRVRIRPRELRHPGHPDQSVHGKWAKGSAGAKALSEPGGGFTVDLAGRPVTTGLAVGIQGHSEFHTVDDIRGPNGRRVIAEYIRGGSGGVDGANAIGGWHDSNPSSPDRAIVLDRVRVFPRGERAQAIAFGREQNQISIYDIDAGEEIPTGGTGDRGRVLVHEEAVADRRVQEAGRRDDGRGDRRAGSGGPGALVGGDRRGRIRFRELRHPGHPDQSVHGKWAKGRISPVRGKYVNKPDRVGNNSVGALNDVKLDSPKDGAWPDGTGVGDASVARLQQSGGVTQEQAVANLDRIAEEAFTRAGGPPIPGESWYEEAGEQTRSHADEFGLDQEVGIGMTAAQSPMTEWKQNQINADIAMEAVSRKDEKIPADAREHLRSKMDDARRKAVEKAERTGKPYKEGWWDTELDDGETLSSLYQKNPTAASVAAMKYGDSMDPARASRLGLSPPLKPTASAGYDPWSKSLELGLSNDPSSIDRTLNGVKVRSFYNNISDPRNSEDITIDTHMQRAATNTPGSRDANWRSVKTDSTKMSDSPSYGGGAGVGAHPALADAVRTSTDNFNSRHGTSYTPSQFQAIVWTEQIRQYPQDRVRDVMAGREPESVGPERWGNQYGSGIVVGTPDPGQ